MGWSRIGDEFPADRRWDGVPYDARWHYLALMAACSKSQRFDCRMPLMLAHRASDVPDPEAATEALVTAGFLVIDGLDVIIVEGEAQHMLPPHKRDRTRKENQRRWTKKHRETKCENGEHDEHCPATCPRRAEVDARESSRLIPQDDPQEPSIRSALSDAVHDPSQLRSGKCLGKPLPQDRTGQDRTSPRRGITTVADVITDFFPPRAVGHDV
jgi:hypothetical protein